MADKLIVFYPLRRYPDGRFDSICLTCFATIATAKTESELLDHKRKHVCSPATLSQRAFDCRPMEKIKAN
jgi:hypothetical protein